MLGYLGFISLIIIGLLGLKALFSSMRESSAPEIIKAVGWTMGGGICGCMVLFGGMRTYTHTFHEEYAPLSCQYIAQHIFSKYNTDISDTSAKVLYEKEFRVSLPRNVQYTKHYMYTYDSLFRASDKNHDLQVTLEELTAEIKTLDSNADGQLTGAPSRAAAWQGQTQPDELEIFHQKYVELKSGNPLLKDYWLEDFYEPDKENH
jgi:hypothetical protein